MNVLNQMVRCSADPRRVDASGRHGQTGRVGLFLHTVDGQPAISTFPSTREVAESVSSRFEIEKGGKVGTSFFFSAAIDASGSHESAAQILGGSMPCIRLVRGPALRVHWEMWRPLWCSVILK